MKKLLTYIYFLKTREKKLQHIFSDCVVSQLCGPSGTSHACRRRCRSGTGSAWSVHSDETFGAQSLAPEHLRRFSCCEVRRTSCHPAELPCRPAGVRPHLLTCTPRHEVSYRKQTIHCSVCYTDLEQKLNQSAPSVCNPVGFGKKRRFQGWCLENSPLLRLHPSSIHLFIAIRINILSVFSGDHPFKESGPFTCAPYPPCLGVPCYLNKGTYLHPDLPQKLRAQSPCVRTAPPSPMQPRRVLEDTSMEMSNQESLDKLRMTVQQAASSMESSSKDIRVLGERMVAATDRMTETVQSLVLLTQVVDRLQTLLTTTRTDIKISHAEQSGCSSSSSASSLDAPSTSTGPSPITANHQGPPLTTVKTGRRSPGDPDVSIGLLTNGELELTKTADNVKGCHTSQRRKKKKKKKPTWVTIKGLLTVSVFLLVFFLDRYASNNFSELHLRIERMSSPFVPLFHSCLYKFIYFLLSLHDLQQTSSASQSRRLFNLHAWLCVLFSVSGSDHKEKRHHGRDFRGSCYSRRAGRSKWWDTL